MTDREQRPGGEPDFVPSLRIRPTLRRPLVNQLRRVLHLSNIIFPFFSNVRFVFVRLGLGLFFFPQNKAHCGFATATYSAQACPSGVRARRGTRAHFFSTGADRMLHAMHCRGQMLAPKGCGALKPTKRCIDISSDAIG